MLQYKPTTAPRVTSRSRTVGQTYKPGGAATFLGPAWPMYVVLFRPLSFAPVSGVVSDAKSRVCAHCPEHALFGAHGKNGFN